MDKGIIFCRTKLDCDNLENYFYHIGGGSNSGSTNPFSCVCLHGDRSPDERKRNLEIFKVMFVLVGSRVANVINKF